MELLTRTHPVFGTVRGANINGDAFVCLEDICKVLKVDKYRWLYKLCHKNFMPPEEIENNLNMSGVAYLPVTSEDKTDLMLFVDESNLTMVFNMFGEEPTNEF